METEVKPNIASVNTKYWLVTFIGCNITKLRGYPVLNSKLLNYSRNLIVAYANHIRYSKNIWIGTIRSQAPKFQRTRNMEKVQRLNGYGLESLFKLYDCLKYSLVPFEKMR
jgi:hypothetical protein